MIVESSATRPVQSMMAASTGPRSDRKPTPAAFVVVTRTPLPHGDPATPEITNVAADAVVATDHSGHLIRHSRLAAHLSGDSTRVSARLGYLHLTPAPSVRSRSSR